MSSIGLWVFEKFFLKGGDCYLFTRVLKFWYLFDASCFMWVRMKSQWWSGVQCLYTTRISPSSDLQP